MICSSKTSVDTQRTTQRYFPEDRTLHNHRCENLKSYIWMEIMKKYIIKLQSYWLPYRLKRLKENSRKFLQGRFVTLNVFWTETSNGIYI
jgi:hypothetical protein